MQKFLNKLFSSKMLAQCLIESCADKFYYQNVMKKLGNALIYFLYTKNFEISKDLLMQIFACDDHLPSKELFYEGLKKSYGISDKNVLAQKLLDNALTNGYVCHSVNPIFKNTIFKNGLGVQVDINPILNLKNLEEKSYKNKFFKRQSNNSFYYTIPSGNAMHYACNGAPERVFGGPLKQMHKDVAFEDDLMAS